MEIDFRTNGQTSNILRVQLRDSESATGGGKTAMDHTTTGLIISTICDNEATPTVYKSSDSTLEAVTTLGTFAAPTATKARFKKVDDTNNPGLYELQLNDARFAVASALRLRITITAPGVVQEDTKVLLNVPVDVRKWLGATAPANTGDAYARLGDPVGSSISADLVNIAALETYHNLSHILRQNTSQAGGSTTITLDAGASDNDNEYVGNVIVVSASSYQSRIITAYNGTTKVATVHRAWDTNPSTSQFYLMTLMSPALDTAANVTVADASITDAKFSYTAELSGPAAGPVNMVVQMWRRWFKKRVKTDNGTIATYNNAGDTVLTTSTCTTNADGSDQTVNAAAAP